MTPHKVCIMQYTLCSMHYAVSIMHYALCNKKKGHISVPESLYQITFPIENDTPQGMHYAVYIMQYALCSKHYALCIMQ